MENQVLGIHHVTAITDEPQRNVDFYAGILGLRFVKRTVNFDAPDTYHFYYGDELGRPGTILTFFSWPGYPKGRRGTGQVSAIAFSIPESALAYWQDRLSRNGVSVEGPIPRFDDQVLLFQDPDGLSLELIAHRDGEAGTPWAEGPIPVEYATRGFHSVTLSVAYAETTTKVLTNVLGFHEVGQLGNRRRYQVGESGPATLVDVLDLPNERRGQEAVGSVHHVAWRTATDENQVAWRERIAEVGLRVTEILDRNYFHSIYFREPSGVLFEIATDQPGFAVDEDPAELGTHLKLPEWFESRRAELERVLPPITIPTSEQNK
ncbi:diguanylate cyclase [Dictyobacter alpinus]|uniref:Diguanylate cyclase n=1 Tax=Dictyobacter alpinus TaxID=2014873 RepID=A0A402B5E7_9CHLR|nr:ring-cleaving dioxygenase [Dictyobacter alpinus]GCE26572.1 diguanylate cyclase [Dictyobacter alpinus]